MFLFLQGAGLTLIGLSIYKFYKAYDKLEKKHNFLVARWNEFSESEDYKKGRL